MCLLCSIFCKHNRCHWHQNSFILIVSLYYIWMYVDIFFNHTYIHGMYSIQCSMECQATCNKQYVFWSMRCWSDEPSNWQMTERKKYVTINYSDQWHKKLFQKLDKRLLTQLLEGPLVQLLEQENKCVTNLLNKWLL